MHADVYLYAVFVGGGEKVTFLENNDNLDAYLTNGAIKCIKKHNRVVC